MYHRPIGSRETPILSRTIGNEILARYRSCEHFGLATRFGLRHSLFELEYAWNGRSRHFSGQLSRTNAGCKQPRIFCEKLESIAKGLRIDGGDYRSLSNVPIVPFDHSALEIFDRLKSSRIKIPTMDLRIAAIALANDLTLVTETGGISNWSKGCGWKIGRSSETVLLAPGELPLKIMPGRQRHRGRLAKGISLPVSVPRLVILRAAVHRGRFASGKV